MNQVSIEDNKQFIMIRLISSAILIIAPILYLFVASYNTKDHFQAQGNSELIIYLLIPIALIEPFAWIVIKRVQIGAYKKTPEETSLKKMYYLLMMVKLSLVSAIYIYGLVAFFLTNEIMNMTWFYLIGIVWSVIYWPRKAHFERVMNDGLEAI